MPIAPTTQPWQFVRPGETPPVPADEPAAAAAPATFQFVRPGEPARTPKEPVDSSSEEFARIIDQKIVKRRRSNRRSFLVTMILLGGSALGGTGWFISNPDRVTALRAVVSDIRTATDVGALREKYAKALAKIGARKNQINEATSMIGVDPTKPIHDGDEDFGKEMKEMMGDDAGPTVGERNKRFGATADKLMKAGLIKDTPPPSAPAAEAGR